MRKGLWILLILLLNLTVIYAQQTATQETVKKNIILTPVTCLTDNKDFFYLKSTIYNVLLINLKKQERLAIVNDRPGAAQLIGSVTDFETYFKALARNFPGAIAIISEYYVARDKLQVLVNVWEIDTLRIKNSFIQTMPADLDMLPNIEKMSAHIAAAVAEDLPLTEREALFNKQIVVSLRKKINDEERFVEEIFSKHNEITAVPFTGLGLGKTAVSWTPTGPLISPVLSLGYSYFFDEPYHLRFNCDYLGFDLLGQAGAHRELSFEILFGLHTRSSFSFSLDAGVSGVYDYNEASAALAYTMGIITVNPPIERFSLSIPVKAGFTIYLSPNLFISLNLKYNGLTVSFEPRSPSAYDVGKARLKYFHGLSPWNLLSLSVLVQAGVRF